MELRKDYILDRWVYYASERKKRPREFKKAESKEPLTTCFFCIGNENLTPPEIGRISENGKWIIRWFDNKFPAVEQSGNPKLISNGFFTHSSAYGKHEIIVEYNEHEKQLWDLSVNHIKKVLAVYKQRLAELMKAPQIKYVLIFKNHGKDAGTSLIHTHTQVVSLNTVPTLVNEEAMAVSKYKNCPYCDIIKIESKSPRKCFENRYFVAIAPYASRFNYEVWVFPKWHVKSILEMDDNKLFYHADILNKILSKLKKLDVSYNFYLHYAPKNKDLHYHVEILPRIATWGGFELGTSATINSVLPEDAARFYRG